MYLWVIIATFIAALFAMNGSIRSDIKELYVEPQAQTVVTKLYVQHRAAMNYITKRDRNSSSQGLSYKPGELTAQMLKADLPYGFQQESGFNKFTTWVYCLDKDKLESSGAGALPASCMQGVPPDGSGSGSADGDKVPDTGTGGNCCAGSSVAVYLVTYGCVPSKWRDVRSGKPDGVLLSAMKTTTGFTHGMGYAVDRTEVDADIYDKNTSMYEEDIETNMGVYGQGGQFYVPIPNYVSDTSMGGNSFANVCGRLRKHNEDYDPGNPQNNDSLYSSCDYCLVYMSKF